MHYFFFYFSSYFRFVYLQRIARDKNDPDNWIDYGVFCLYINNLSKAEECFRQCVSINQSHFEGYHFNLALTTNKSYFEGHYSI